MTAQEWVHKHFPHDDEYFILEERRAGITAVFLAIFGPTIQTALDAGRNPVDDLCALPEAEKRGWGPDFEAWKQRGIGV